MRKIEFRAWIKNYNCYADVLGFEQGRLFVQFQSGERAQHRLYVPIEDCVLEQYTGLKDKNGQKIYNGDIVSEEFEYGGEKTKTIWQVRWCDDECAFELHYVSGLEVDDFSLNADDEEDYEIIGNIHQNPELLGEKDVD